MGKYKTLSKRQHLDIAARLNETRTLLYDASVRITNGFGVKSRAANAMKKVVRTIDNNLAPELKRLASKEFPEEDFSAYDASERESRVAENPRPLTYAEHLQIGMRIKEARKLLQLHLLLTICNGLPNKSKAARTMWRVFSRDFDEELRNELQKLAYRDCGNQDVDWDGIYYGPTAGDRTVLLQKPLRKEPTFGD
jgi:hypothetical protein